MNRYQNRRVYVQVHGFCRIALSLTFQRETSQCADAAELRDQPSRAASDGAARIVRKGVSWLRFVLCSSSLLTKDQLQVILSSLKPPVHYFSIFAVLTLFICACESLHIQMVCPNRWARWVAVFLGIVRARQCFRSMEWAPTVHGDADAALAALSRLRFVLAHVMSRG